MTEQPSEYLTNRDAADEGPAVPVTEPLTGTGKRYGKEIDLGPEGIRARHEAAHAMVSALCKGRYQPGGRDWTMSIPARPDDDPDLVIGAALQDIPRLLAAMERLMSERDALRRVGGVLAGAYWALLSWVGKKRREEFMPELKAWRALVPPADEKKEA